jgi:hypothetical protein
MKTKKLLSKLKDILDTERKAQLAKYDSLKKVTKSLRAKKIELEGALEREMDKEVREEITSKLKIVKAQRKKAMKVLKQLKAERKTRIRQ